MLDYSNTEFWAPISNFPGYSVSSFGRVKSTKKGADRILSAAIYKDSIRYHGHQYPTVCLYKDGRGYCKGIHRLVLNAFSCASKIGKVAAHLDGRRTITSEIFVGFQFRKTIVTKIFMALVPRAQNRAWQSLPSQMFLKFAPWMLLVSMLNPFMMHSLRWG